MTTVVQARNATLSGRARLGRCLPILLLILLPVIARWPATTGWLDVRPVSHGSGLTVSYQPGPVRGLSSTDPSDGMISESLGKLAAEQWLHGMVPWWNPYSGVGLPLAADGETPALLFPLVLLLHLRNGLLLLQIVMQVIAGVSTYALLRRLGLLRPAALAGGALFELNGTFAWFAHGPMMPVAFLPLLVLGVEQARQAAAERQRGGWGWIALALASSLYAAFPETAYIDGLGAGCFAVLRLVQLQGGDRWRLLGKLVLGACTGLLLAAPFLVPFLTMLQSADLGPHGGDLSAVHLPPEGWSVLFLPYVRGPILAFTDADPTFVSFYLLGPQYGGYTGAAALVLGLVGVWGRTQRPLRLVTLGLILACLATIMGMPGTAFALRAVPMLAQVAWARYSPPLWEFGLAMLSAFAIDDWVRGRRRGAAVVWVSGAATFAIIAVTNILSLRLIRVQLAKYPEYLFWLTGSLTAAAAVAVGLLLLLHGRATPRRAGALVGLALAEAAALFCVPSLSGVRKAHLDQSALRFLDEHLGLARFYSPGGIAPSYGAYFGLASLNDLMIPAPRRWIDYVRTALSATGDPFVFTGASTLPGRESLDTATDVLTHLQGLGEAGVRYLVIPNAVPQLSRGLGETFADPRFDPQPFSLAPGEPPLRIRLRPGLFSLGKAAGASVALGTYGGKSRGALELTICSASACRTGQTELAGAVDGGAFPIALDGSLVVDPSQPLEISLRRGEGSGDLVLWRWPSAKDPTAGLVPDIHVFDDPAPGDPRLVYRSEKMNIFELSSFKPYWEVRDGQCVLLRQERRSVGLDCATPATLVRRELDYPGWRAFIGENAVPVQSAPPIFQSIAVPAGQSVVRFEYRPPYFRPMVGAFLLGCALLAWGGRRTGRAQPTP